MIRKFIFLLLIFNLGCASVQTICEREQDRKSSAYSSSDQCISYQNEKVQNLGVFLAILGAAFTAAAGSQNSSTQDNEDYRGCCSYHGGIQVQSGEYVSDYLGRLMCNDGTVSPTCKK